jgi:hypothetical protein
LKDIPPDPKAPDFSLVLGGPLFQFFRRVHLSGNALELLNRRVVFISAIAWLPLLVFSVIEGHAQTGILKIPFLYDVEAHARFLIALPALIIAEVTVHLRLSPMIRHFVDRRIVAEKDLPAYNAAIDSTLRIRNSMVVEAILILFVYTFGVALWRQSHLNTGSATWFSQPDASGPHLTIAGYWYGYVSSPIFQFILLRWYMRIVLWLQLLWRISRLDLKLTVSHPDRSGGIGFLGKGTYAFGPILFAQGTLLSAMIATRVLYEGKTLQSFQFEAGALIIAMLLFVLGPLLMFLPLMDRTQRKGIAEFGLLAQRYTRGFEDKWIRGTEPVESELLGTADIQSLADLANSYTVVSEMGIVPFTLQDAIRLTLATAVPLLPLALTVFSVEEVLSGLVKILL